LRAFLDLNRNAFPTYLAEINKDIEAPDQGTTRTDTTWL
jgi:hypothetical protein